jgi:hypothetical protein
LQKAKASLKPPADRLKYPNNAGRPDARVGAAVAPSYTASEGCEGRAKRQ